MENNKLTSLWRFVQDKELNISSEINVEEIIKKEHCTVLGKLHQDAWKEMIASLVLLAVWIGLLLYAYVYLNLSFTFSTNWLFGIVFLFLLFSALMGVKKYYLIHNQNRTSTIRESFLSFRKRVIRANMFYLIVLTVYFYLLTARIILVVVNDFKGISQSGMLYPMLLVILMLAGIPWLIRMENKHRYRKLFRNLDESLQTLDNEGS